MQLHRSSTAPSDPAPEAGFTGVVRISGYFRRGAPSTLAGAVATFAPGARTSWKSNPLGQTVVVTAGVGWAQSEGEEVAEVRAGDVLWFEPGTRHWEGATPTEPMTYLAVHEQAVEFLEPVTDEQYGAGPVS